MFVLGFSGQGHRDLSGDINQGHSELSGDINQGNRDLSGDINQGHRDLSGDINQGHKDLTGDVERDTGIYAVISVRGTEGCPVISIRVTGAIRWYQSGTHVAIR
jgi:hypothetical protein